MSHTANVTQTTAIPALSHTADVAKQQPTAKSSPPEENNSLLNRILPRYILSELRLLPRYILYPLVQPFIESRETFSSTSS
jgi:hypothetical protein